MGTEEAKKIYKERASSAEWVNAGMRNRGLYQFLVRGLEKVRAVVLIHALVHNLFATIPGRMVTGVMRLVHKVVLGNRTMNVVPLSLVMQISPLS